MSESSLLLALTERLSIVDKDSQLIPFKPNWAQEIYYERIEEKLRSQQPVRAIVLKARQLGISTATQAMFYGLARSLPRVRAVNIADEVDNSQHLLGMSDTFWEEDPLKPLGKTKYQAKNTLAWDDNKSSIRTTTAGNKKAGRSRTITMVHASEVAFWPEPELVMNGLMQAIPRRPRTIVVMESTAFGRGNYFHKQWLAAVRGETELIPFFFPWWMHPEYRASHAGIPYRSLGDLDEEEKGILALFKNGLIIGPHKYEIPPSQWDDALAWRRWAIYNLCQGDILKFHQEYPSTPEEAFVATGLNVFPQQALAQTFKPENPRVGRLFRRGAGVEFVPDISGPLRLFRLPHEDRSWGQYVIGADATHTLRGDYAVAQVLNRRSWEQVAVWRGRIDPIHFGEEVAKLGIYFNTALVSPENEGPGYATIGALMQLDYPNMFQSTASDGLPGRFSGKYGYSSSYKTKSDAISWLLRLVLDNAIVIHDRETYDEMDNYVTLDGGGYGPGDGVEHDDTVMAMAIGVMSSLLDGPLPAYGSTDSADPLWTPQEQEPSWMTWGDESEDQYA